MHHHHCHCHSHQDSCGCSKPTLCPCGCGALSNCSMGDYIDLTKKAKHWLLKEKIKDRLEKEMGPKLDSAADLAVEMLIGKMEMKQQDMKHKKEMMVRMKEMMTD